MSFASRNTQGRKEEESSTRAIWPPPPFGSVRNTVPLGAAVTSSGLLFAVGSGSSVSVPDVVILPTLPVPDVNHRSLPHGLGAIDVAPTWLLKTPMAPVDGFILPMPN